MVRVIHQASLLLRLEVGMVGLARAAAQAAMLATARAARGAAAMGEEAKFGSTGGTEEKPWKHS